MASLVFTGVRWSWATTVSIAGMVGNSASFTKAACRVMRSGSWMTGLLKKSWRPASFAGRARMALRRTAGSLSNRAFWWVSLSSAPRPERDQRAWIAPVPPLPEATRCFRAGAASAILLSTSRRWAVRLQNWLPLSSAATSSGDFALARDLIGAPRTILPNDAVDAAVGLVAKIVLGLIRAARSGRGLDAGALDVRRRVVLDDEAIEVDHPDGSVRADIGEDRRHPFVRAGEEIDRRRSTCSRLHRAECP